MRCNLYKREDYGGFWRRYFADSIDAILLGIAATVVSAAPIRMAWMLEILIFLSYMIGFKVSYGATPGYRILDMRIVAINGAHVTVAQIVVRLVSSFASALAFGLGFLWIASDENKQAWHDKIAGTYVIRSGAQPVATLQIPRTTLIRVKSFAAVVAASVVVVAAFVGGLFYSLKSSDAYQLAERYIRSNPRVVEAVGFDMDFGLIPSGNISASEASGEANFSIHVSGEKGEITVIVALEKSGGRWAVVEAAYTDSEGNYVDIKGGASRNRSSLRQRRYAGTEGGSKHSIALEGHAPEPNAGPVKSPQFCA